TMECGLREAPLAQPERVLARQEAIAERVPETLVERALVVVASVVLQHVFDVGWVRKEESMIRAGLQMNEVAVSISGIEKRAYRIGAQLWQHTKDRITARSGRIGS